MGVSTRARTGTSRLGINIYISDRVTGTQVLLTLKPNSTMVLEYVCVSCDRQPYCTAVPGPGHVLRTVCAYKNISIVIL